MEEQKIEIGKIIKLGDKKEKIPKIIYFEDDEFIAEIYDKKFKEHGFEIKIYHMPSDNFLEDILEYNPNLIITNIFYAENEWAGANNCN